MDTNSKCKSCKNTKTRLKAQQLEDIKMDDNNTIEDVFPWLPEFNTIRCSCTGSRNYQHLERLLLFYTQNILSSVAEKNVKFSDAINLKNHINSTLTFFHLYWLDIKQDVADHSLYLSKISALLNVYINMELKTSMEKRTSNHVRHSSKIAAKILAALYIYLNNSEEHIFRVLLRIEHTTEKYTRTCILIFTKSFTNVKTKTASITDVAYIRYLLAFKMWRKMEETSEERINKLALMLLGPRMPELQNKLLKFVPRPPMGQDNETLWLIQSNLFDLKQVHEKFLLFEDKMDNSTTIIIDLTGDCEVSTPCKVKRKKTKRNSKCLRVMKDIMRSEDCEVSIPCKVKRKKTNRNSGCLRVMKDIMRSTKHINPLKYSGKLVSADVKECSNEDKTLEEKIRLERKPVYDIKIRLTCQNNIADQHSFKQELPTSTNCMMQQSHKCCNTMLVDAHGINHLIIKNLESIKDYSSQITEIMKHTVCHQVNECPNCCTKSDCKPFNKMFNNDITAAKAQETLHDTFNDNEIKLACDTNIICTQSNCNKRVFVNHIDEHVMTVHAGKRVQYLDKSNDACTVSTTFTEDKIIEPLLCNQHVNFDNVRTNDYDNARYSEATMKQKKNDCDSSILADPLYSSESCTFDINSFEIGSNAEVDYDMKSFPKIEEADEITKPACVDDLEHINFLNIQNETVLKDFFGLSSKLPQINYDNLTGIPTKKPHRYTDNDVTAVKTLAQDTLHNIFNDENDVKTPYDTNIITLSDRDNCIYVRNQTGEHVMTTSAEKRMQCLDNSNDVCTVSTTFTGDQIVESSLDACQRPILIIEEKHVNSDNRRKYYEDDSKYSEATMKKQQGRSDCNTSMLDERLHSSELFYIFDSFEIDEASEIMKTDDRNDSENISFKHDIQTETLEDVLSNNTSNFLPMKQSLFDLDNVYTDTSLNEKNVLCNN